MHLGRNPGTTYTHYGSTVELTMTDLGKDLGMRITSSLKPSLQCDKALESLECLSKHSLNYREK